MRVSWFGLLIGASILVGSFVVTLLALNHFSPSCPSGVAMVPLQGPFTKTSKQGVAYATNLQEWSDFSDDPENTSRSNALVCENNVPLGPAHSFQGNIETMGQGRFAHWKTVVIFSASDNSDPNTNGRRYSIVRLR
jgi:hypothetical protein